MRIYNKRIKLPPRCPVKVPDQREGGQEDQGLTEGCIPTDGSDLLLG